MAEESKEIKDAEKLDLKDLDAATGGSLGDTHKSDTQDFVNKAFDGLGDAAKKIGNGIGGTVASIGGGHISPTGD